MTRIITRHKTSTKGLLATALLTGLTSVYAGETVAHTSASAPIIDKPADNPLSFFNGLVTFDAEERFRFEVRSNNYDFNSAVNAITDDNWFEQRFRIGMLIKPTSWLKIYAQGQDSREINSDRPDIPGVNGAEGDDSFDLRQGYIEFGNTDEFPLTLKVGRQILSYGDERLVGSFDWNNIGRTFDAVKLRWEQDLWSVDAFASSVVNPTRGKYDQSDFENGTETHRSQVFSGIYFNTTAIPFQSTDVYAFHLHENNNPDYLPTAVGDTNFFTFGLRVQSKPGAFAHQPDPVPADGKSVVDGKSTSDDKSTPMALPGPKPVGFDYNGEFAFQTGKVRGLDLTAWALHAAVGYTFDVPWLPRLGIEYNYATGDRNPADGDIETFQNLFPTNHKFYGIMDLTSWQNMEHAAVELKFHPVRNLTAQIGYRAFFIASNDDVWYRANGTTAVRALTPAAREADSYEGSQIEAILTWNVTKNVQFQGGYAHFFAGDYLRDTGAHDDADFGYVQATIAF